MADAAPMKNPLLEHMKMDKPLGQPEGDPDMDDAMADFAEALKTGDHAKMGMAFKDACSLADKAPHEEGPDTGGDEGDEEEPPEEE